MSFLKDGQVEAVNLLAVLHTVLRSAERLGREEVRGWGEAVNEHLFARVAVLLLQLARPALNTVGERCRHLALITVAVIAHAVPPPPASAADLQSLKHVNDTL